MSDISIRVTDLGKRYRIGKLRERHDTLRDAIASAFKRPKTERRDGENTIWALKNVGFEVRQGEVVGIIGPNGAGKSTLLKILSRITEPTEGQAEIHGRCGSLLEVGTGFHSELTGRENIYLNGAILGMRKTEIDRKFDEIVAFAEVEKFLDTPVKRYSSGMYVRLAFAVAAHLEPEILLVDEVLTVGDHEFQKKCLGKMGDIGRDGRTVLLVSHNLPSILNFCRRAILLSAGRVAKDGQAAEVVQEYLSTARSAGGEVVWPDPAQAPGNDIARLHAVRILQNRMGSLTANVDISEAIDIQIEYWNLREDTQLYPAIWLRDQMGTLVLSSSNHKSISLTEDSWYGRSHPIGLFQSVCRIPGNFLNEGLYSVTAIVGRRGTDTLVLEDYALSFHVHDTGEMRKEFLGEWVGTVRPRLAWHTEFIGPTVEALNTRTFLPSSEANGE